MFCKKCQKEIDNDSKFCEYCRARIENISKAPIEVSTLKKPDKDLETLRSKPWYRFLKILYIIGFGLSILFTLFNIDIWDVYDKPPKIYQNNNATINCEDYRNFREIPTNTGWRNNFANINEYNRIVESCDGKDSYMNVDFYAILQYVLAPFIVIAILIIVIAIFELLRQVGYYIFLGKFYPHPRITKLFKK